MISRRDFDRVEFSRASMTYKISLNIMADVIYRSTKNLENRLHFELQYCSITHFEGFFKLSAFPLYLEIFGDNDMV